jgi:prepilin-type processing-associated H-X9-DG protein
VYYQNLTAATGSSTTNTNYGSYAINCTYRGQDAPFSSPTSSFQTKVCSGSTAGGIVHVVRIAQYVKPSETAWVADNGWGAYNASGTAYTDSYPYALIAGSGPGTGVPSTYGFLAVSSLQTTYKPVTLTGGSGAWSQRHLDKISVLFCDGHVKSMSLQTIRNSATVNGFSTNPMLTVDDD